MKEHDGFGKPVGPSVDLGQGGEDREGVRVLAAKASLIGSQQVLKQGFGLVKPITRQVMGGHVIEQVRGVPREVLWAPSSQEIGKEGLDIHRPCTSHTLSLDPPLSEQAPERTRRQFGHLTRFLHGDGSKLRDDLVEHIPSLLLPLTKNIYPTW